MGGIGDEAVSVGILAPIKRVCHAVAPGSNVRDIDVRIVGVVRLVHEQQRLFDCAQACILTIKLPTRLQYTGVHM